MQKPIAKTLILGSSILNKEKLGAFNLMVHVLPRSYGQKLHFFEQLMAIDGVIRYETRNVQKLLKSEYPYSVKG